MFYASRSRNGAAFRFCGDGLQMFPPDIALVLRSVVIAGFIAWAAQVFMKALVAFI